MADNYFMISQSERLHALQRLPDEITTSWWLVKPDVLRLTQLYRLKLETQVVVVRCGVDPRERELRPLVSI